MKKTIAILATALSLVIALTSCQFGGKDKPLPTATPAPTPDPELVKNTIKAAIELENGDIIELELYPDLAPDTVENFVELAKDGFYDGTIFHRVIEGFMIQGGGYDENLKKKNADTINGEFALNGFENTLAHTRGVISMARAQDVNSASSQFFIVQQDSTYLDGQYAAFGRVTEGMDVVDDIASERTGSVASMGMEDVPVDPIVIETITIGSSGSSAKRSSSKSSKSDEDDEDSTARTSKNNADPTSSPKTSERPLSSTKPSMNTDKSSKSNDDDDGDDDDEPIARLFGSDDV